MLPARRAVGGVDHLEALGGEDVADAVGRRPSPSPPGPRCARRAGRRCAGRRTRRRASAGSVASARPKPRARSKSASRLQRSAAVSSASRATVETTDRARGELRSSARTAQNASRRGCGAAGVVRVGGAADRVAGHDRVVDQPAQRGARRRDALDRELLLLAVVRLEAGSSGTPAARCPARRACRPAARRPRSWRSCGPRDRGTRCATQIDTQGCTPSEHSL